LKFVFARELEPENSLKNVNPAARMLEAGLAIKGKQAGRRGFQFEKLSDQFDEQEP
jgi:hypothetical protein